MEERSFHPVADLFPLLEGEEFERFVESIREHGQQVPILVMPDPDGRVLDGRNRWLACRKLGVVPRTRTYDGDTSEAALAARIAALNLERRHLNESQRAMIAARLTEIMKPSDEQRREKISEAAKSRWARHRGQEYEEKNFTPPTPREKTREKAGKLLNVSGVSVTMAKRVLKDGVPELVAAVESGSIPVYTASKLTAVPEEEQRAALAGGKEEIRAAARRGELERMAKSAAKNNAKVGTRKSSPKPKLEVVAHADDRIAREHNAGRIVDACGRIINGPWSPEESAEKFPQEFAPQLEAVLLPALEWLRRFEAARREKAAAGGAEERRA